MKQLNLEKKVIAIFLILCIAAAVSLSALFIVNHVDHDCTGEDCGVCQEISACLSALRRLTENVGGTVKLPARAAFLMLLAFLPFLQAEIFTNTLITLKIRLNN